MMSLVPTMSIFFKKKIWQIGNSAIHCLSSLDLPNHVCYISFSVLDKCNSIFLLLCILKGFFFSLLNFQTVEL